MTNPTKDSEIGKLSLRHGLLIGTVSVVLFIVFYLIDPVLQFTNFAVPMISFVVGVALFVVLGLDVRKKIGGFWTFGTAFKSLIIMSVVVILMTTVASFIVFKYVNPDLSTKVADIMTEKMTETYTKLGLDQAKIDAALKQGDLESKFQPSFKNELTNVGVGLLFYAILNLIIAAIIKKNPPLFVQPADAELEV